MTKSNKLKTDLIPEYDEYYPWRGKWGTKNITYPWERNNLNKQFLKHEKKRVEEVRKWFNDFRKSRVGTKLDEISFYTVPVRLSGNWKTALLRYRNRPYLGLSALFNSPQSLAIAIFYGDLPSKYSLIRITESETGLIRNKKDDLSEKVILVKDWDYLPPDKPYVDVDFEKRVVSKLLSENSISDKNISVSFQSPIMGAPFDGDLGGVSLSSFSTQRGFTFELIKTIELMAPPEYRSLSPPKQAKKGKYYEDREGIEYKIAEKPPKSNHLLSGKNPKDYSGLKEELKKRMNFKGDYSIFSTIRSEKGTASSQRGNLFSNFNNTEITIPRDLYELQYQDVNVPELQKLIDDELWIQVAHAHQFNPTVEKNNEKFLIETSRKMKSDFETLLADDIKRKTTRKNYVDMLTNPENILRLSQSLARSEENEKLKEKYFKRARDITIDNFSGFIQHRKVKYILDKAKERERDIRFDLVQTFLINNPRCDLKEIWDYVKGEEKFRDMEDLQGLLDWMKRKGMVIRTSDNKYVWV